MIDRYSREEIKKIWEMQSKFTYYLNVELAVCEAYAKLGEISKENLIKIKQKAKFEIPRIDEIEAEVHHDVIAFLTNVNENLGAELAQYMHVGMTSSDVIDTAFALQIQDAGKIILKDLQTLISTLKTVAKEHKHTICIGRSHGIHAEVMTFGLKMLNWIDILKRQEKRFANTLEEIRVGQISGPVGTYSNISPKVEELTCEILNLKPAKISTQIISRDYHAGFMQELSLIASVIEQFAVEIRHLQKTEVLEVEEGFSKGQKGSSAMPHKKNPILCENLCGLSRIVRANSIAALEDIPLWHERDISHSSTERVIFPDSTILVDFMLDRFNKIMKNLVIHKDNMAHNANLFGGIVYSQKVLLKLIAKGKTREEAYEITQKLALLAFNNHGNFKNNVEKANILSPNEVAECFSQDDYLKNVDTIFERFE